MFGSSVLEVAIGLCFCYATVALIVSTVQEGLASALHLRAHTLLDGIKTMLNDPYFTGLARALYAHALVNPHDDGKSGDQFALRAKPSYIEPAHFAIALVDTLQSVPGDFAQLGRDIDAIDDAQVRTALQAIYQRAGGDLEAFRTALAGWFDSAMERISGAYKRRSMMVSVLLSMLLAILFNIDSIHLFRTLWQHPALAAQVLAAPSAINKETVDALFALPIGWSTFPPAWGGDFLLQAAGWVMTAASTLFGAPFWFDSLQKIMQLRGTGAKPGEKAPPLSPEAAAADGRR
jgi:hypothetical protein